jgi:Na+/proline symporter
MHTLDWIVLFSAMAAMVVYGVWKGGRSKNIEGYLLANRQIPWYMVGLGAMATQASAITFLSTTGQGYTDGMRFVQFYFGLPLAMIVLCITVVPIFHRLHIFTAYEFLEKRFDLKTRTLASFLFLIQRGLSTGLSIYAPSIVLSTLLGWDLFYTNVLTGGVVIVYTLTGGARAVAYTQMQQMLIIWSGMFIALGVIIYLLPSDISFFNSLRIAGKLEHLQAVTTNVDLNDRYTLWTGLVGGFFLQLSYFGTDQSQVQRYLTGSSVQESRMGLLLNGMVKVPMQVIILFVGVMVFMFYQFSAPPIYFNQVEKAKVYATPQGPAFKQLEQDYAETHTQKAAAIRELASALDSGDEAAIAQKKQAVQQKTQQAAAQRAQAIATLNQVNGKEVSKDNDYVFLTFVMAHLPMGLVGLLVAVIFAASMSSCSAALNSLAATTLVDVYKRMVAPAATDAHYVWVSKLSTVAWGVFCILMAGWAAKLGNLIEAVNILGSLFYGTILGIFVVGFYMRQVTGSAVFWGAVAAEVVVIALWKFTGISYLWYNLAGCALVMLFAEVIQRFTPIQTKGLHQ